MPSNNLIPVNGVIQNISEFDNNCCMQEITIRNSDGIQNFIVSPDTYVISEVRLRIGMNVTAFYDADLPLCGAIRPEPYLSRQRTAVEYRTFYRDRHIKRPAL